jgi:hypothetical protein
MPNILCSRQYLIRITARPDASPTMFADETPDQPGDSAVEISHKAGSILIGKSRNKVIVISH